MKTLFAPLVLALALTAALPATAAETAAKPTLSIKTLDGKTFTLAEHKGNWVIVNFWATWCSPCIKELPELSAFVTAHKNVRAIGLAYEDTEDADEVVDRAEEIIFGVAARRVDRDLRPIRVILDQYHDRVEYLYQHRGEIIGIPTGLADLDKLLGGMQRSDVLILAGRPGMGKTSLALSIALHAARRWQKRIALFSLEMSDEQLVQRLISAETGIDSQRLRLGDIKENEWPTFMQATNLLSNTSIFIDDKKIEPIRQQR